MRLYKMNWFMRFIMPGVQAICLFPFGIYFRTYEITLRLLRHEKVRWFQQKEMLCIFFYIWYVVEWFIKIFFCGKRAYMSISFEFEARQESVDTRKRFGWMRYIFRCYKYPQR